MESVSAICIVIMSIDGVWKTTEQQCSKDNRTKTKSAHFKNGEWEN